ncbi:endonuclease III [Desulfolutivibrio sp.]|uniref:endonuclease III n=1 Tax=Desulfolutivibrio sp. TaxID=2773296 RepID=UPI002F96D100
MDRQTRAGIVLDRLRPRYPGAASALIWTNPYQLLVSTVLAAQCTDARVNLVTPEFFRRWPDPAALAAADVAEVEVVVHSTGFFRNKAKNLVAAAKMMVAEHGGAVPRTLAELTALPGLARKTANIVSGNAYGNHEGIAVDTHVKRLSYRLDLTDSENPVVIERDLIPLFPREAFGEINHLLVLFGRDVCQARKPRCEACPLADVCPRKGLISP